MFRVHNKTRSKREIESELFLLNHLKNQNLTVPTGKKNRNGEYVLEFENLDETTLYITLMTWITGDVLASAPTEIQAKKVGCLLAKLHDASTSFVLEENHLFPQWGLETFCGNMKKLSQYHGIFLSDDGWDLYQSVADKILMELEKVPKCSQNYGLIHGDFHLENIIFKEDVSFLIDFGRRGYDYFLSDIASTILGLDWQKRKKFVEGYISFRKLEEGDERLLETLFIKVMIENYCHHCSNPNETKGLLAEQPYAQAYMQAYLQGQSFLFEPLEL